MTRVRRTLGRLVPVGVLAIAVGGWQLWVSVGGVKTWILPAPTNVAVAGWQNRTVLAQSAGTTLLEATVGLVIGTIAGLGVAFVIARSPYVRRALWPIVVTSQTIPVIVLAPLVAIWFGYGLTPKIVLVALIAFFPVAVAAVAGMTDVDPELIELLRSMGAHRWDEMRIVRIPAALGQIVAGIQIAAAYAVGSAVIGEYVGGTSGLGIFIDRSHSSYRTDQMLAGVVVIAVASIVLFSVVGAAGRWLTPWQHIDRVSNASKPQPCGEAR